MIADVAECRQKEPLTHLPRTIAILAIEGFGGEIDPPSAYLAGIGAESQLSRDPLRGFLFENLVIVENGRELRALEIKSSPTFRPEFVKGLISFSKAHPDLGER